MRRRFGLSSGFLLVLLVLAHPSNVLGADSDSDPESESDTSSVEGVVTDVANGEMIIDLGSEDGLPEEANVQVYRRVEVTHPVTDEQIVDRFKIGETSLDKVGEKLSITSAWNELDRKPSVGDHVVWRPGPPPKTGSVRRGDNSSQKPECEQQSEQLGRAEKRVHRVFRKTLGEPIDKRIAMWQGYLQKHSDSDYAVRVKNEIEYLQGYRDKFETLRDKIQNKKKAEKEVRARIAAPEKAWMTQPIAVSAMVLNPERVDFMRVFIKDPGADSYRAVRMERQGEHYWRVDLSDHWQEAGLREYFVEAVRVDQQRQAIEADAKRPKVIDVDRRVQMPADQRGRSRARTVFEFVNFNAGGGTDQYSRFESDYRYAIDTRYLTGFRMGVGLFSGEGASIEAIEAGESTRPLTIGYGYAETLFEVSELFGGSFRLLAGNQSFNRSSTLQGVFGLSTRLRFGKSEGTRLVVGASQTENIGNEAWVKLHINALENVPMSGEAVVTNLPVGQDLGVSLNYEAGYELVDGFRATGRLGWNARTISHHGPSAGLGMSLDW